ncbi:MAG: CaiB/BaiF CoA transferase family protein [Candidatus Hydrothermarchaeota archaeon]
MRYSIWYTSLNPIVGGFYGGIFLTLEGLRVLDLTRVLAGPYTTMILCDLGAEVIKIEEPKKGDEARGIGPFIDGVSAYFLSLNRGKKSITLNLKKKRGREILLKMCEKADILVENFRPGVMARLGLDYHVLKEVNPRLIYAACSGFGQTGPYAHRGAYDMIIQGMGGIISITGEEGMPPVRVGVSIGDITAAFFTTIGILAALYYREKTGKGQMVDVGMLDCQVSILENAVIRYLTTGEIPKPLGSRHPSIAPFEAFPAKDGYVIFAVGSAHWENFCREIGREDLIDDPRFKTNALRSENHSILRPIIAEISRTKTVREWIEKMEKSGVPCGPINTVDKVVNHPQVRERGMIIEIDHPEVGPVKMAGNPIKLSLSSRNISQPAPKLGEHTEEVLKSWIGLDKESIENLRGDGVI